MKKAKVKKRSKHGVRQRMSQSSEDRQTDIGTVCVCVCVCHQWRSHTDASQSIWLNLTSEPWPMSRLLFLVSHAGLDL